MSGIAGSCSESPSAVLFDQGIQKAQEAKLQNIKEAHDGQSSAVAGVENRQPVVEGAKGSLFDAFA